MNHHHLSGEQRLGLCMLVATGVVAAIIIIAVLVIGGGRSIPSDTPTSLHP